MSRILPARSPNLRKLAKIKRWIIVLIVFAIAATTFSVCLQANGLTAQKKTVELVSKLFVIPLVFFAVITGWTLGMRLSYIGLYAVCMFVPGVNLLAIVSLNVEINNTFREAGLQAGLFGVSESDVELAINQTLCRGCGYNLTANISGRCPECGRAVPVMETTQKEN